MSNKMEVVLEVNDKGTIKVKRFGKTIDTVGNKGASFGRKMAAAGRGIGGLAAKSALAVGKMGLLGAGVAALGATAAGLTGSVRGFADFEVAINKLGNVTDQSLAKVKGKIMELPPELGAATDLTKGYYQVMSAGVTDPVKSMELLVSASKAAKESGVEQGEVVRGLASVMGAYKDELKGSSDAADLLYSIERSGITSIRELIPIIGSVSNLTSNMGISADEMAAGLAQITASGGGTNKATTEFMGVLRGLAAPTEKMKDLLADYGGAQKAIKELGFSGVMQLIMDKTKGNAGELKTLLGTQEGMLGALQLTKGEMKEYGGRLDSMKEKTGAAEDAWQRYKGTLTAIWDTFKNTVGKQLIMIGEQLAPALKDTIKWVSGLLDRWRDPVTERFANIVGNLEVRVRLLVPKFKEWAKIVRDEWLPAARGILEKLGRIVDLAARGAKFIMKFIGEGSSQKPLTEKADEMTGRMDAFSSHVSGLDPELKVSFNSQAAAHAIDAFVSKYSTKIATLKVQLAEVVGGGSFRDVSGSGLAREAQRREILNLRQMIAQAESTLTRGVESMGSFAGGTGPRGLPDTGTFYGHKGEIVLDPRESDQARRGGGGDINFTVQALVADQGSIRQGVRILKREMDKQGIRWGD